MFERYTNSARRTLFFARYEASEFGGTAIDTEHLLLGLIRQGGDISSRILRSIPDAEDQIRREIGQFATRHEKVAPATEIPFSEPAKRVLQYASEEADRMLHNYIGTEHLLLGLLREPNGIAARVLGKLSLTADGVRASIVQILNEPLPSARPEDKAPDVIERLRVLVEHLGRMDADGWTRSQLVESINQELDRLKERLGPDQRQ